MPPTAQSLLARLRSGRVRILWLVLGALLLVSALPIGLYHIQVLQLSQEKLVDTEKVQQTELTRSLAQEIQLFESNLTQQLITERQILALAGLIDDVEDRPAFVVAVPLKDVNDNFTGMLAAVVSLAPILHRLQDASVRGRTVFVVDHGGHIVAHPDVKNFVPGADASGNSLVAQVKALPQELRSTETIRFTETDKKNSIEMIGTYSTFPEVNWAVIEQRRLDQAQSDTGVTELNKQALAFVTVVILAAILVGYFFAVGISGPIRGLAAAIDEKDPYTRGHSGRVAKYSTLIGQELALSAEELDKLRISALLHDVGTIGVEDRVLKKPGALTPEEFGLMKQHTVKGANIMRPVSQLKEILPGIELHHEHIDGRGYPYGLQGQQIPLMARIIGVADTLDAMTTNRPYQSAMDLDYALGKIKALAGTKFDTVVVNALEAAVTAGRLRLSAVEVQV